MDSLRRIGFAIILLLVGAISCEREEEPGYGDSALTSSKSLSHEMIVLGERLDNPYTTENVQKAYDNLYGTKARMEVPTTNLYVRFLPKDEDDFRKLDEAGIVLTDHPLDYQIITEGDYYHDPTIPSDEVTWQYAVVEEDFKPIEGITCEIIDNCCLMENIPVTRAYEGTDWNLVEREAYRISGNENLLNAETKGKGGKVKPSGRISIIDDYAFGGKPAGVSGVMVVCNSFVKFSSCYTDRDGYYTMDKTFSSNLRYRLVFKNEKGFAIGLNLLLLPASVSTLGKESPEGINVCISDNSDSRLFRRCVANNAAYEYICRCSSDDLDLTSPPADIRIWLLDFLSPSSAVMLHHGTVISQEKIAGFLGDFAPLVTLFSPDLTIGTKGRHSYRDIYDAVVHEMAHTSHFAQVGTEFWDEYIHYIIESFLMTGGMTYGSGGTAQAGYCEVGEMWAYYMESKFFKDRYGGNTPSFGTSYWFFPQIFRSLDDRGISAHEILKAMQSGINSKEKLKDRLITLYPGKKSIIEQTFDRY